MLKVIFAGIATTLLVAMSETGLGNASTYTLPPDDSRTRLSTVYHTSVPDPNSMNHLRSETSQVEQEPFVLTNSHSSSNVIKSSSSVTSSVSYTTYVVESGDTVWGIANRHGESVNRLESDNGLSSGIIQVGQKFRVSGASIRSTSSSTTTSRGDSFTSVVQQASPSKAEEVVRDAKAYLGTPYVWGGSSPSGFDCSGFVRYVMAQVGIDLPHSTYGQVNAGKAVSRATLEPGDLVFFYTGGGISHVGIYVGGGTFIHSDSSAGVTETSINDPYYWSARYATARRVL